MSVFPLLFNGDLSPRCHMITLFLYRERNMLLYVLKLIGNGVNEKQEVPPIQPICNVYNAIDFPAIGGREHHGSCSSGRKAQTEFLHVRKAKKWNCKLCGEKQTILKVYGNGSGADCRCHVQKLNHLQGVALQETDTGLGSKGKEKVSENVPDEQTGTAESQYRGQFVSRWNKYLVENPKNNYVEPQNEEESSNFTDPEIFSQQSELSLKCRIQKDTPSHDYQFQGSQHFKRPCSQDSNGEAKRFKICESDLKPWDILLRVFKS